MLNDPSDYDLSILHLASAPLLVPLQYFQLVGEMESFEREKFDSFEAEAIYQINSVIKGNVLRLAFVNDNQCNNNDNEQDLFPTMN